MNLHIEQNAEKELHGSNHLDDVHILLKSSALGEQNLSSRLKFGRPSINAEACSPSSSSLAM